MPVLATYFTVRRGRDPFFKFYMKTLFPRQVRQYSEKYGIRFIGWYNVAHGWDFDNVILFELPSYGVLDEMERDDGDPVDRPSWVGMDDGTPPLDVPPRADGTRAQDPPVGGRTWKDDATPPSPTWPVTPRSSGPTSSSARASSWSGSWLPTRRKIRDLGGLVLIDDDPDYLAVAPDGTFRSRSRVYDEGRAEWVSETEVIETAAELAELYNPADILQAFADSQAEDAGIERAGRRRAGAGRGWRPVRRGGGPVGRRAARGPRGQGRAERRAGPVRAGARLPGPQPADRGRADRAVRERRRWRPRRWSGRSSSSTTTTSTWRSRVGGFRGRVIPEGETAWEDISSPDQIVRYYDPTDVFGDLAEAHRRRLPVRVGRCRDRRRSRRG